MIEQNLKVTEYELVQLVGSYGYDVSKQLEYLKENEALVANNQYYSFMKKVNSICNNVKRLRKIKGEPVYYTIGSIKDKPTEIIDKRAVSQYREDDYIISFYIYNKLIEINKCEPYSYYEWSKMFNIIDDTIDFNEIEVTLKEYYDSKSLIKLIKNRFIKTLKDRNNAVVRVSFNILSKLNLISVKEKRMITNLDNERIEISEKEHLNLMNQLRSVLSEHNITLEKYINHMKNSSSFNGQIRLAMLSVKDHLRSNNILKFYTAYEVELLAHNKKDNIELCEVKSCFMNKIVQLTIRRNNENSNKINKRFYTFNTLLLLKELKICDVDKELFKKYEKDFIENKDYLLSSEGSVKKQNYYVYRFLNNKREVIYVGKTNNIYIRINQHLTQGHLPLECYGNTDTVEFIKLPTKIDMDIKELYYINKWKPIYNERDKQEEVMQLFINEDLDNWKKFNKGW